MSTLLSDPLAATDQAGRSCPTGHRARSPAAFVARAEAAVRQRGQTFTPMRRRVLEALASSGETPLGAYAIAEQVSATAVDGRRIAPVQVYRALHFLIGLGLVHRIATRNAYLACDHEHVGGETVVFLVCQHCGAVQEAAAPPALGRGLEGAAAATGFRPTHPVVEVEGECAACQASH